ncbi:MAG: RagB/SusD family nutrient uptake outer membrane protein [Bacteroidetes bacterium B1(2017)]|nr:MAG: RagB/SusD family nutrient uptake outer membrane protein [Bacteroidetes bacterium B1(2017)]
MNRTRTNYILSILFLVALGLGACKKDFLNKKPISEVTEGNFFKTGADAESAIIACYNNFQSEYYVFDYYINNDVVSDNCYAGGDNPNNFQLDEFTTTALNGNVSRDWNYLYDAIGRCNAVLDNVGTITSLDLTEQRKQEILGEAAFIRAFHYFQLVNLYGDVPLIIKKVNSTDPSVIYQPRSSVDAVYASLIADLKFAADRLPVQHPQGKQRVTKGACNAMLARAYAQKPSPDWQLALQYAEEVTSSASYQLLTDYDFLWDGKHENSSESIFEIQFINSGEQANWGPMLWLPPSMNPTSWKKFNMPSNNLVAAFKAAGDTVRLKSSILFEGALPWKDSHYPNDTLPFPYKQRTASAGRSDNNILIRLADIILLQAEAKNELGNTSGAKDDLNLIRTRAKLGNTTASTQAEVKEAIANERRLELAFEGQRWFDLKRSGNALTVMNNLGLNYSVTSKGLLFPIPQVEMDRNPKLIQNPGY